MGIYSGVFHDTGMFTLEECSKKTVDGTKGCLKLTEVTVVDYLPWRGIYSGGCLQCRVLVKECVYNGRHTVEDDL